MVATEIRAANGQSIAELPAGIHAIEGHRDIAIVVLRTGEPVVIERFCPHYFRVPEKRRDLTIEGRVCAATALLECEHLGRRWDVRSGLSLSDRPTKDLMVFDSFVLDGLLFADLYLLEAAS